MLACDRGSGAVDSAIVAPIDFTRIQLLDTTEEATYQLSRSNSSGFVSRLGRIRVEGEQRCPVVDSLVVLAGADLELVVLGLVGLAGADQVLVDLASVDRVGVDPALVVPAGADPASAVAA